MAVPRQWLLLSGALIVVGALYNHYLGHSVLLFEMILLAVGAMLALYAIRGLKDGEETDDGLLTVFLARFLRKENLQTIVPLFGLVLLVAWSAWKILYRENTSLTMQDFIVTIFCVSLMLYYSHTTKYQAQKDFVVLYVLFLTIVFAVIWNIYTIVTGESYVRITAYSEFYFITTPVVSLVNLLGVEATAVLNLTGIGLSNIIEYMYEGHIVRLGIGAGCSGLYSAGLFFSAFTSFVLVRYRTVNLYMLVGLGVGLVVTWASNIIRMVVTVLIGAEYGAPALATFHMYFGILLFIAVITVFWIIVVRWLDRKIEVKSSLGGGGGEEPVKKETAVEQRTDAISEDAPTATK